jgi:DNA-binding CsgD family transcriptional regulator
MMPMSMVGRMGELDELVSAWSVLTDHIDHGTGTVTAVITGNAGVGKSMLVTNALAALDPRPRVILSGTARVHAPAPYDWLAAVLSGRDTSSLPLPREALAWLAQHPDAQGERFAPGALLRMAVRTVRALVEVGPAVLVVEDLHALDPASLNLIAELAAAADLPALLLVTSQPPNVAVSPQLAARTLARLSGTPGAIRQHLGPLVAVDIQAILSELYPDVPIDQKAVRAIQDRTGGNPYWIRELLAGVGPAILTKIPQRRRSVMDSESERQGSANSKEPGATLTAREAEVLTCLAAGMSNKQVARSLGISIRTVAVHVSNLLRKTRSSSRTEAALWAVKHSTSSSS